MMSVHDKQETINDTLKNHAVTIDDWKHRDLMRWLHEWRERFNSVFGLGLMMPAIRVDPLSRRRLGQYRSDRNGLGLEHEVTLNSRYLDRPQAKQLSTLFHELLHEWQSLYGTPGKNNYHNRQFCQKASIYGLVVDCRGRHLEVEPGRFTNLLTANGVDISSFDAPGEPAFIRPRLIGHGESKLKKWSCGCTNVRCAVELAARCLRCGNPFCEAPPSW